MTRHQLTHPEARDTGDQGRESRSSPSLPATEMVRQLLARGHADPHAIADIMVAHPGARMEIFLLLHRTVGNAFASEVSRHAVAAGGLGESRDVTTSDKPGEYRESRATIDGPPKADAPSTFGEYREPRATIDNPHRETAASTFGEYRESRATIDGPPKAEAPSTFGEYQESRATIDGPPKAEAASAFGEYREDRATIDGPPKAEAPSTFGEYQESRATIDHPHAEKAQAPWVGRARRFNRAHADNVRAFLDATGTSCVDPETGELDPNKVARWQADHGLPPDGRVGDQTVRAAVTDPSLAL